MGSSSDYTTVHIPKALAEEIDRFIDGANLGYRSRAEFVKEAIRRHLRKDVPLTAADVEDLRDEG